MPGKGTWQTPNASMRNREEVWRMIDRNGWPPAKLDPDKEITYFSNKATFKWMPEYDHFFAYTKVLPLWDQRKMKDNDQYLPDLHERIYQQEGGKAVPVLTSLNYGLACRPLLDYEENTFRRQNAIVDFYRKNGHVIRKVERRPQ